MVSDGHVVWRTYHADDLRFRVVAMMRNPLSPSRDRAFGRFLGKRGAQRVLEEAEAARSNRERIAHWRNRYCNIPLEHTLSPRRKQSV